MSNTPDNPFNPQPDKGPWLYSGGAQPTAAYTPPSTPVTVPATTTGPTTNIPAAPAAAPAATSAAAARANEDASIASIIDTIEAIIIALILALTFRAFIVEAFVIPTGSMAPTLLGAHFKVICPKCGYSFDRDANLTYQFDRNSKASDGTSRPGIYAKGSRAELLSNRTIPADGTPPLPLVCPNCQYVIPYEQLPQYLGKTYCQDLRSGQGERFVPFAWANNGDRILVLKYIYSLFEPKRFDVIVFKEPMYAQDNFIKRLIGLPGETIEIVNGDIFVTPAGQDPQDLRLRTIARKPAYVQKNLWQLVYNNDFYPTDENVSRARPDDTNNLPNSFFLWHNPWSGQGATADGWCQPHDPQKTGTVGGPIIHYTGSGPGTLAFSPREPYDYNILGYNNDIQEIYSSRGKNPTLMHVGDLHLETEWTPQQDGAGITMAAGIRRNLFSVTWSGHGLEIKKFNLAHNAFETVQPRMIAEVPAPSAGHAYHLEFNNVDHAVQFFLDGKAVLEQETPWTAADARNESNEALDQNQRETFQTIVSIDVTSACTLAHLKLMRDLYYTQLDPNDPPRNPAAANQGNPLILGPDEFFALGDNSRKSHDGRTWQTVYRALDDLGTRRGIVPRRYLLGKAFFVYWPAGYRLSDSVYPFSEVPLVPNAGDMRFIR